VSIIISSWVPSKGGFGGELLLLEKSADLCDSLVDLLQLSVTGREGSSRKSSRVVDHIAQDDEWV